MRVKEQWPRKLEEVVAALFAPRIPKEEDKGYPSIGKICQTRRLRPEDEEKLVKRLYVCKDCKDCKDSKDPNLQPKDSKENSNSTRPRRSAAEQRAYLDRFLKPKESENSEIGEFMEIGGTGSGAKEERVERIERVERLVDSPLVQSRLRVKGKTCEREMTEAHGECR